MRQIIWHGFFSQDAHKYPQWQKDVQMCTVRQINHTSKEASANSQQRKGSQMCAMHKIIWCGWQSDEALPDSQWKEIVQVYSMHEIIWRNC